MQTTTKRRYRKADPDAFLEFVLEQTPDADGWRPAPFQELYRATGMQHKPQTRCRAILQERGVLEVRRGHLKGADGTDLPGSYLLYRVAADGLEDYQAAS